MLGGLRSSFKQLVLVKLESISVCPRSHTGNETLVGNNPLLRASFEWGWKEGFDATFVKIAYMSPAGRACSDDGDRQMVAILSAVRTDGLADVDAACTEALSDVVHSADVILNVLARRRDPTPPLTIMTPGALRLHHAPITDCNRYDRLRWNH